MTHFKLAVAPTLLSGILALVFSSSVLSTPKPEMPQLEPSNLQEVKHDFFDTVKLNKSLDLSSSTKIYIDTATVGFSKYWEREHRSDITGRYKEKTLERYSKILFEELKKACEESPGFDLVNTQSEADLVFIPKVEKVNIYAPDDSIGKSLVYRAGSASFNLTVLDAKSEAVLVHFVDGRETVDRGYSRPIQSNRGTNSRDFRMLMARWSERSFEYLEALKILPQGSSD